MNNLGGHDLPSLVEAFGKIDHDRPTCFICYTVKGFGLPFAGHKDNHAGLMTPAQMEAVRAAMNIRPGHEWDKFEGLATPAGRDCKRSSTACRSPQGGERRLKAPRLAVPDMLPVAIQPDHVDADRLRRAAQRAGAREDRARRAHRHHLARRHGLDQSRAVGEPPRPVRARDHGRHVQERAHPLDLQLGVLAEGPAHRARHRRDEPVHPAVRARPVAPDQRRAAAADRHAVRPVHRARPRCAQLRLLPGGALHPGGDAVRHHAGARGRRAPVDRAAADRHGAGRARGVRAGLRRRACRHHGVRARLHPEGRRRRGLRAQLAARRDRRLDLSAALDAAGRADQARDDARSCGRASSTAPIGCASPGRTARWWSPIPARSRPRRSRPSG